MFDFSVFIVLIITIIGFYFPFYMSLNKEIKDLSVVTKITEETRVKICTRKKLN